MSIVRFSGLLLLATFSLDAGAAELASRMLLLDAAIVGDQVIAVGERGTILTSPDAARSWTVVPSRLDPTLTALSFADGKTGWAVGHDALIAVTTDGGATWSRQWQGDNLSDSFLDVIALDAQHAIAVGAYGLAVATIDGGRTWSRLKVIEDDYHLNRITRGPTGTLYIAGEHGTLLRSGDGGATWKPIATDYDGSFYGILPLGERSLLAYGLRGRVYRSDDDGASWAQATTSETVLLATGVRLASGRIALAGAARGLLLAEPGQSTFVRQDIGVTTGIAELLPLSDGALLAVGEAGARRIEPSALAPKFGSNPDRAGSPAR